MFNFEKLESWNRAIDFADLVYLSTRDFPREEMFGLTMQCGERPFRFHPISRKEARGLPGRTLPDFTEIATGSLFEVVSQSVIAKRQGFLSEDDYLKTYQDAERLGRMLSGLRGSLLSK